ncbi:MAG: tetratricopeptide repeat protein [Phycisphaerales bacterium]
MSDHASDETLGPDGSSPRDADATLSPASSESAGDQIGHYRLLEPLGEGGFGTVWAAEQREPIKRRVALKIIKLGMDTRQVIARFEAERQALAMMDHPNIAKVFDAGATGTGRPYFVMELVKGVPIVEYCDREKLDTEARLDLFVKTCNAIQHAHQKGIIHRDIKPSNVLVTLHDGRPVPKVIDFGIAKATNQELTDKTIYTQHRQMIGTPAYMSPEQAEMSGLDIDTRSDIYSLGVLLYEMLTGTTPFSNEELNSAGLEGMMRMIRDVEPHKPSTRLSSLGDAATQAAERRKADVQKLGLLLRGDLDWIVMKCLEKDRTRRYDTASGLAADIDRHLNDEPVSASPPSTGYRLRKFVKRNKGQVAAGGLVAALLVLGIIGTSWGMAWAIDEKERADEQARLATAAAASERIAKQEAEQNAQRAIEQAERAEAAEAEATSRAEELQLVADFQAEQLGAIEPQVMGANLRRSLIDAAAEGEREAVDEALASINFTNIAMTTLEENIFEPTIEAIDTQFEDQPLVRAQLLHAVASTLADLGLLDLATSPLERAVAIRRSVLGFEHSETLQSLNSFAVLLGNQGKFDEAEPLLRENLEISRRVLGDDHPETLATVGSLGVLLLEQDKLEEAEPYLREQLDRSRRLWGNDDLETLESLHGLGVLLFYQGRYDEAEPFIRESLETSRRLLGDEHSTTLSRMGDLGWLYMTQGRFETAESLFRESIETTRRVLGDEHPDTLQSIGNLGSLFLLQDEPDAADPLVREVLETRRRVLGNRHPDTLISMMEMGSLRRSQGNFREAESYFREVLAMRRQVLGDEHRDTLSAIRSLGALLRSQGRLEEAEPLLREAVRTARRVHGDAHPITLTFVNSLGVLLSAQGRPDEAEPYYREILERMREDLGDEHPATVTTVRNLAIALDAQGKYAEAEPLLREALEGIRRELGDEHRETMIGTSNLARLLADLGRGDEALLLADEVIETGRRVLDSDDWLIGNFLAKRGRALEELRRYGDAADSMLEGHAILTKARGEDDVQTRRVVGYLADLYDAWHQAEPDAGHDASAAEWRAKLDESGIE